MSNEFAQPHADGPSSSSRSLALGSEWAHMNSDGSSNSTSSNGLVGMTQSMHALPFNAVPDPLSSANLADTSGVFNRRVNSTLSTQHAPPLVEFQAGFMASQSVLQPSFTAAAFDSGQPNNEVLTTSAFQEGLTAAQNDFQGIHH